ncbi:hypothetical protein ACFOQM_17320 [Paenibacillus sp. GCM10012307]|uniref:hypothetical protein n=1 Tax=Paenibacillus sp. GCM10012307 TaxID=3317343 RepID=UPI00361FCFF1
MKRTSLASRERLADSATGLLPDEGIDDTGLFKGIFVRYLTLLMKADSSEEKVWGPILQRNGEILWKEGIEASCGLAGPSWERPSQLPVQLRVQLSAAMILEALAELESTN